MTRTTLVATDFSESADRALEAAFAWAEATRSILRVAHVFDSWKDDLPTIHGAIAERTRRGTERGLSCVAELLMHGDLPPNPAFLDCSRADWVFVGTHGRSGLRRLALGSWAEDLVRRAPRPVVVVGPQARIPEAYTTITVGLDLSPASLEVLGQLRSVGAELGCRRFNLVCARPAPLDMIARYRDQRMALPAPDLRDLERELEAQRRACEDAGFETDLVTESDVAAQAILRSAARAGADLIAVGSHGRKGLSRFLLGSVADEVIRSAQTPVYIASPHEEKGTS